MNRTITIGAGIFCLLLSLHLHGRTPQGEKLGPGFGQRYLVLATMRTSTMQKELSQAAAAGYRVLAGWSAPGYEHGPHTSSLISTEIVMLLEKVAVPPKTYEYLLLSTVRTSTLQKELREAGARGFRLVPNTASDYHDRHVVIMEKAPESSNRYDYLVVANATALARSTAAGGGLHKTWLAEEKVRAVSSGYSLVGIISRTMGGDDGFGESSQLYIEHHLIAERPLQPESSDISQISRPSAGERYLFLVGNRGSNDQDWQGPLNRAADQGYRLLMSSYCSFCPEIVFVMEKVAHPDETYEYSVVSGQDQLSAAAAKGFHPHPAGAFGPYGILMEKAAGSESQYEYFSLWERSSSALQKRLVDAGAEGLNVVAASRWLHMVVLQKAAGQIAESQAAPPEPPPPSAQGPLPSSSVSPEDRMAIPPDSKVYVRPMGGFETYLIAALKRKVPVVVVVAPEDAEFEISGTVKIHEPSKAVKALETIGAIASARSGESAGGLPRKLEVSISVRNVRTGAVILEHTVSKRTTGRAVESYKQSAAEECADYLDRKILERKPN